jgi:ABC-2 type transport system ATP-binding protein
VHDSADLARGVAALRNVCGGEPSVEPHTRRVSAAANGGPRQLLDVVRELDDVNVTIDDIALHRPTLDDVFLTLTGHAAEEAEAEPDVVPAQREQ